MFLTSQFYAFNLATFYQLEGTKNCKAIENPIPLLVCETIIGWYGCHGNKNIFFLKKIF